jgi:hypothetical protein
MTPDLQAFAVDLATETKSYVQRAIEAGIGNLQREIKALETELATLKAIAPAAGPSGEPGPVGPPGVDGKNADEAKVRAEVVADLQASLRDLVREEIARAVAAMPAPRDGRDGKDVDVIAVKTLVEAAVAGVKQVDVVPMIRAEVAAAVAALPAPKDGRDGVDGRDGTNGVDGKDGAPGTNGRDGVDGKDGAPGLAGKDGRDGVDGKDGSHGLAGKDGTDGIDGKDGSPGANGRDGIDGKDGAPGLSGKDGRDGVDGKDGAPGLSGKDGRDGVDGKDGAHGLNGKDGASLVGALIDRDSHLVLTLSDGGLKDCGVVVGKDVEAADVARAVEGLLATWDRPANGRDGIDGKDGLGFDELSVGFDESTGYVLRFARGTETKEFPIAAPWYAGTWQAGRRYPKGAKVTKKGAEWTAKADTFAIPGESKDWQLSAKGGRDGRDAPGVRSDE